MRVVYVGKEKNHTCKDQEGELNLSTFFLGDKYDSFAKFLAWEGVIIVGEQYDHRLLLGQYVENKHSKYDKTDIREEKVNELKAAGTILIKELMVTDWRTISFNFTTPNEMRKEILDALGLEGI